MSSAPELEELERELIACKGVPSSEQLIKYLRLIRELKIRDSETVARFGSLLLKHHRAALGEEERE
jgi:hypothetical protein